MAPKWWPHTTHCDAEECDGEREEEGGEAVCVQQSAGSDWLVFFRGHVHCSRVHQKTPGEVRRAGRARQQQALVPLSVSSAVASET